MKLVINSKRNNKKQDEVSYTFFFASSNLVARNFTLKIDKWDDRVRTSTSCIYNAMSLSTDLNLWDS
jgi:hypothetical protein